MSSLRDQARRRLELNPIATSIVQQQQHQQHLAGTPATAISASSLSAPFGYHSTAAYTPTPVSAVRQYNPQQWIASPAGGSEQASHYPSRHQDPDVTIPAPPPYSPPRSQRAASEDPTSAISPATRAPMVTAYRPAPEVNATPIFPPPPGNSRGRAGSTERQPFFSLSPFSRRSNAPETPQQPPQQPPVEASRDHAANYRRSMIIQTNTPTPPPSDDDRSAFPEPVPPAARRAASAGAIGTPTSARSRGSSVTRWEPGMPLPPPPPGPPPHSRSQSMNRTTEYVTAPLVRRPQPISNLGPVPPTPAGWVDEAVSVRGRSPNRGLTIDTSSVTSSIGSSNNAVESNSGSSSSGLIRAGALRGEPKSIRERRSESRTGKAVATESPSNNPWAEAITPADITLPASNTLTRRPTITRSTPRSGRSNLTDTPRTADTSQRTPHSANLSTPGVTPNPDSRGSTPRPLNSSRRPEAPTPPFSPNQPPVPQKEASPAIPPKSLPTPPPQSRLSLASPPRPISHILHAPNIDPIDTIPLMPSRPGSRQSSVNGPSAQESQADQFARSANERHQAFALREAAAKTDEERVRIFAEFIVAESRLRRDRYAAAIDVMGSEILELTRDLFRPSTNSRRESAASRTSGWTPDSASDQRSYAGSVSNPQDISLPSSEPTSASAGPSPAKMRPDATWWTEYRPSLSPIPSMSVSEAPDGSDSRGRPSSRWWEVSQDGSTGTPSSRLERSKRESKYMGMPRELREAMQFEGESLSHVSGQASPGPSNSQIYGPNEYPPEKTGLHENPASHPALHTAGKSSSPFSPAPVTPNPNHLDVSRLVTLPPPFPRHHPAVNNNHPDLTSIRTVVRSISDFTEVQAAKERFLKTSNENRDQLAEATAKKRSSMRLNIQREIEAGKMTYAEAAVVEATALASEQEKTKEASKADFDLFQTVVVLPVNDILMDRINRATELFTQLRSKLFVDAQQQNPNQTQEEGDEQPELLEKLTLLKWIFEAREQLHREVYELLSDRNDRYKEVVVTPYRLSGNDDKYKNAVAFFADDAAKRKVAFEQEILKRTEEFMDIIEENVVRGVEVQLSAFWDIAPSLSRLVEKIPRDGKDLETFRIQIPQAEYEENPRYYDWPLQYLHSLLSHCEKSTYQFIESQINLLCLLHEVKGGVTAANCRLMRAQRLLQGEREEDVDGELKEVERDEEKRLTDDLKDKVRDVEKLWSEGLGSEIKGIMERIKGFLVERGGWCDDEE
ncbi:hypothetical protein F5884DRAFT_300537 [Xylogone sp. PMI_703]|nr:hypothetical protein F5884DRAFT_300537 [Xylogone sp. PMI_703]